MSALACSAIFLLHAAKPSLLAPSHRAFAAAAEAAEAALEEEGPGEDPVSRACSCSRVGGDEEEEEEEASTLAIRARMRAAASTWLSSACECLWGVRGR
jgi:hypothetical protein